MTKEEVRVELQKRLTKVPFDKIPTSINSLIDESIESVINGTTRKSDKAAGNLDEAIDLTIVGIQLRMKILDQTKEILKDSFPNDNVTINYRGSEIKV